VCTVQCSHKIHYYRRHKLKADEWIRKPSKVDAILAKTLADCIKREETELQKRKRKKNAPVNPFKDHIDFGYGTAGSMEKYSKALDWKAIASHILVNIDEKDIELRKQQAELWNAASINALEKETKSPSKVQSTQAPVTPPQYRDSTYSPIRPILSNDPLLNTFAGLTPNFDVRHMTGDLSFLDLDENDSITDLSKKNLVIFGDILKYKQMGMLDIFIKEDFSLNSNDLCNIRTFECLTDDDRFRIFGKHANATECLLRDCVNSDFIDELLKSSRFGIPLDLLEFHPLKALHVFASERIASDPESCVFGDDTGINWNKLNGFDFQKIKKKFMKDKGTLGKGFIGRAKWASAAAELALTFVHDETQAEDFRLIIEIIRDILIVLAQSDPSTLTNLLSKSIAMDWIKAGFTREIDESEWLENCDHARNGICQLKDSFNMLKILISFEPKLLLTIDKNIIYWLLHVLAALYSIFDSIVDIEYVLGQLTDAVRTYLGLDEVFGIDTPVQQIAQEQCIKSMYFKAYTID
jgi:hypothetical protein